ncbi:MAG TPA: Fe2+-dependent dioxygenase [Rhizomicrobium sp.]
MFLLVKDVLTPAELDQIGQIAKIVRFVDGRTSNPHNLAKNNLQMDISQPEAQRASQLAGQAIGRNEEIRNFAFWKRIASPVLSRYEVGMTYGTHADAAYLALPNGPLRSDVSATLFIGEPASYEGGELVIHLGSESMKIKGEPGSMILYPSTTLHEVAPVTAGQRLSMFTFMESYIPNQIHRELLYSVNEVAALEGFTMKWENRMRLQFVSAGLHRLWAG